MINFDLKNLIQSYVEDLNSFFLCHKIIFTVRNTVYKVLSKQTLILPCTSKHDMQKARNIKARPKVKCLARWFNISPKFRIQPSIQMRNHPSLHEVNKNADFMGCTSSTLGLSYQNTRKQNLSQVLNPSLKSSNQKCKRKIEMQYSNN